MSGKVLFAQLGIQAVANYTQFKKFESENFTLTNGQVIETSEGTFVVHCLLVSPEEDIAEANGIIHVVARKLKKIRNCELTGWVADITNTYKDFQLNDIKRTQNSRLQKLANGDLEFVVEDFDI